MKALLWVLCWLKFSECFQVQRVPPTRVFRPSRNGLVAAASSRTIMNLDLQSTQERKHCNSLFERRNSSEFGTPEKKSALARLGHRLVLPIRFLFAKILKLFSRIVGKAEDSSKPISLQDANELSASDFDGVADDDTQSTRAEDIAPAQSASAQTTFRKPRGDRWAVAAPGVDLTGNWDLIVNDSFKEEYDRYLAQLGQPYLVRSVALGIIGLTTEETKQTDGGKSLLIRGQNVRGVWDRTLVSSGMESGVDTFKSFSVPVMSADSEQVEAESWWEENGTVHVSWLRGVQKYGGGSFESRRFLENDEYVCESAFHPDDETKPPNQITWRFRRHKVAKS